MAEEQQPSQGPNQVNIPTTGMNTDKNPLNLSEREYPFALNANIENEAGNGYPMLQNEHSNLLCTRFKPGYLVIGTLPIPEKDITIFFLINPTTNVSEIGFINSLKPSLDDANNNDDIVYCETCEATVIEEKPLEEKIQDPLCTYETIVEDSCAVLGFPLNKAFWLNFSIDNPIIPTYKIDNCAIIIYWCDGIRNPLRYLRLDVDDFQKEIPRIQIGNLDDACQTPIYSNCVDVSRIKVFPDISNPCISITAVGTGGQLKGGSYQFAICYSDQLAEPLSSYLGITNPTPIFDPRRAITLETDYATDKSIKINFSNVDDVRFRFFNLIVIKTINRITTFDLIATLPSTTTRYVYTGGDPSPRHLTIEDILQSYPFYGNANTVTNANNRLLWGGVTSDKLVNWQSIGMQLGRVGAIKWQTVRGDEDLYSNPIATVDYKGYMRDEVYPIGLVFILKNGQETCTVHIPGRPPTSTDLEDINTYTNTDYLSLAASVSCNTIDRNKRWQLYNTGLVTDFTTCYNDANNTINQTQEISCTSDINYFVDTIPPDDSYGSTGDYFHDTLADLWYLFDAGTWSLTDAPDTTCTLDVIPAGCGTPLLIGCEPKIINEAGEQDIVTYAEDQTPGAAPQTDCEGALSSNTIQPNLTCLNAQVLVTSTSADCSLSTYGYLLQNTDAPIAGCNGNDNNQIWYKFIPSTSDILALTIQCNDLMTIEVYDSCGGSLIDYYSPADAANPNASPIGTACFQAIANTGLYKILSHLIVGNTYYIKVYQPAQAKSTHCFNICISTPSGTITTVNVPAFVHDVCTYSIECQTVIPNTEVCLATPYNWGTMSYWESTETYPDNKLLYGEFACAPIRHHKFPDNCIMHMHDQNQTPVVYGTKNKIYPIGIRLAVEDIKAAIQWAVDNNYITEEDKSNIASYKVVRGNRAGHKSIIAKGLLYDMWRYRSITNGNYIWYSNYVYNSLMDDSFLFDVQPMGQTRMHPFKDGVGIHHKENYRYTFHSPDIHFNNPLLGTELNFETAEYGVSRGGFSAVKEHAGFILITPHAVQVAQAISGTLVALDVFANLFSQLVGVGVFATVIGAVMYGIGTAIEIALGAVSSFFVYLDKWVKIIKSLGQPYNFAYYYASVGRYTGYCCELPEGHKVRALVNSLYLNPISLELQELGETQPTSINNWCRESSVYFNIGTNFRMPRTDYYCSIAVDDSRFKSSERGRCNTNDVDSPIASYYVSNKNYVSDQYGRLDSIQYLDTGYCGIIDWSNSHQDNSCETAFGGDTFISRFALKRKLSYFTFNAIGLTEDSEMSYTLYPNINVPRHAFDTEDRNQSFGKKLFGAPLPFVSFDCYDLNAGDFRKKDFYYHPPAKIYLFNYGVPYFLCESDYNTNFRHGENTREKNFYPNAGAIRDWVQEINVPIAEDNYYFYNRDYSKQNKENYFCIPDPTFDGPRSCMVNHDNRVIYSLEDQYYDSYENIADSWLSYRANDYNDFERTSGKIISLHSIENSNVLAIFENTTKMFNATAVIQATPHDVQVGSGSMFAQKPREYLRTPLGYGGSQNRAWIATEFGYFWTDAKRGEIYHLPIQSGYYGTTIESIANNGMRNWFKENLPYNITRDFPTINVDNPYKDIGISIAWDTRFLRLLITKKDYKLLPSQRGKVIYDGTDFYADNGTRKVSVLDTRYFCNASWTVGYSPITKTWISYYSFLPNYYVSLNGYFQSGINFSNDSTELGLWSHMLTNRSYQVYYGKLYPFKFEMVTTEQLDTKFLMAVNYQHDTYRYQNEFDFYTVPVTFNKVVVYADSINSGQLNLVVQQSNNLSQGVLYPVQNLDSTDILVTNVEGTWKFNGFMDITRNTSIPAWVYNCGNYDKSLSLPALDYAKPTFLRNRMRANQFKIRLTNDKYSNYKFLWRFNVAKTGKSIS